MAQPNPKVTETAESAQMHIVKGVVKKALDKLTGVYQSRTSSGMQWQGIKPVTQC